MMENSIAAVATRPGGTPADSKVLADVATLNEKMDLCHSMLNPGAGQPKLSVKSSESMLAVIGFLEACSPRMVELVEAAATGVLSEHVFAECLGANDRLQKLLADVEVAARTESSADTTAASIAPASVQEQFEDLLLGPAVEDDSTTSSVPPPGPLAKTTGEEQVHEEKETEDSKMPAQASESTTTAAAAAELKPSGSNDEFDAFFAERQEN